MSERSKAMGLPMLNQELNDTSQARHNNGTHPTRISVDVIRQIESLRSGVRAGDAGR
jgi:hypothetical protein